MNTAMVTFNITVKQMTEMFHWPKYLSKKWLKCLGVKKTGSVGVDKMLLHSSCMQTTCARKPNEASQDSYLTARLAGAFS